MLEPFTTEDTFSSTSFLISSTANRVGVYRKVDNDDI